MSNLTLFSNHGHVLVYLARDPEARLRDVAVDVGITERAVQKIVRDLQDGGMVSVTKSGRRNCYHIHKKQPLRHKLESGCTLQDLISMVNRVSGTERPDKAVAHKSEPEVKSGPEPGNNMPEPQAGPESKPISSRPEPVKAKPVKPTAQKDVEPGESRPSNGLEKQQGSLF
jgi:hypothetical protein